MKNLIFLFFMFPFAGLLAQDWEKNYDYVDQCVCGLSKVSKNNKVGYADKSGNEIIKLIYDDGLTFNEGLVAVKKGNKWLYIDSTGKAVTDAIFEDAMSFENGLAVVAKDGLYGYINHKGTIVISCQFENARNFSEGLAPATNAKGFWGYIDKHGDWAIKPQYDYADCFLNNEARIIKGSKVFYINRENKVIRE